MERKTIELYGTKYIVYDLIKKGYKPKEIAEKIHYAENYIRSTVTRLHMMGLLNYKHYYEVNPDVDVIETKNKKATYVSREMLEKMHEMKRKGHPNHKIALHLGIDARTVKKYLEKEI